MNTRNYRDVIRNWLTENEFDLAATYTFTKDIELETADKLMRRYCSYMDRDLYGNAAWRFNKRLQRVHFAETGVRVQKKALLLQQTDGRLHVHSAFVMPRDRFADLNAFTGYLAKQWTHNVIFAGTTEFKPIYSDNWLHYITKQTTAAACDTFLVSSSHIA